ncbi:MAG TPA: hypothetical protein VFS54_05245 [Solirubrobacterales bacterium]|nr:hypothetical protein [Solirubrobacterales bacterium]
MKHFKIFASLAVAAVTTMGFAASASATSITTTTGGAAATPSIHAVNEGGHVTFTNSIANIECSSTIEGSIIEHGAGEPAEWELSSLSFTGCTNSWHVTVTALGTLSINWTSGHNGSVVSNGTKITTTRLGVTCNYVTNGTGVGTLTGGATATLDLSASIPLGAGSSGLCSKTGNAKWSGAYVTTSSLYVAS